MSSSPASRRYTEMGGDLMEYWVFMYPGTFDRTARRLVRAVSLLEAVALAEEMYAPHWLPFAVKFKGDRIPSAHYRSLAAPSEARQNRATDQAERLPDA